MKNHSLFNTPSHKPYEIPYFCNSRTTKNSQGTFHQPIVNIYVVGFGNKILDVDRKHDISRAISIEESSRPFQSGQQTNIHSSVEEIGLHVKKFVNHSRLNIQHNTWGRGTGEEGRLYMTELRDSPPTVTFENSNQLWTNSKFLRDRT
jgi:hypothetical protein